MRIKQIYYSGKLRGTVMNLPEDHPDYTEDTFELLGDFWFTGGMPPTPIPVTATTENKRVINLIKREDGKPIFKTNIIEFKYGTYGLYPTTTLIKQLRTVKDYSKYTKVSTDG